MFTYYITRSEAECAAVNEKEPTKVVKAKKNRKRGERRNARYVSRTDSDSRISRKLGKASALNHLGIISVDTASHVICGATVDFADKRDAATTEKIVSRTVENLQENNLFVEDMLMDAAYSSGDSYRYLESLGITAYIPTGGGYKPQRDGFTYNKEEDCCICGRGAKLAFKGINTQKGSSTSNRMYYSSAGDCQNCPERPREDCANGAALLRLNPCLEPCWSFIE